MRSIHCWLGILGIIIALAPEARSQPKKAPAAASKVDVDRLEKRIEDQQKQIDKLVKAQVQYLQTLKAMFDGPVAVNDEPKPVEPKVVADTDSKPAEPKPAADKAAVGFNEKSAKVRLEPKPKLKVEKPTGMGTIVGKVTGAGGAVIYIDSIVTTTRGTASMKQEGKQFIPNVLVVQRGTTVAFPNMDAIFHNVFSITPDHSFDLGSYPQGGSKTVTMMKSGVVSVYCNMHPQMVGHILVVPNANYVRVGKDGFFRLTNVPAGRHRVVAWAPNSKPTEAQADVTDAGVVTLELELSKGRSSAHTKKDGLPYGSYAQ
jgi:plastocyanin